MSPSIRTARAVAYALVAGVAAVAAVAVAGPSPTASSDVAAALTTAQAALQKKAWPDVVAALDRALTSARREAPLVVREAVVVDAPHTGLGLWQPVKDAAVKPGLVRFYVEVDNVVSRPLPDGREETALEVKGTFSRISADGRAEVIGTKSLGTQTLSAWRTTGVASLGVEVTLSSATPPGRYGVELEVNDLVGGKRARRAVPFVLLPP